MDDVHYPATTSADEWGNEVLALHQLIVEGFEEKWLRRRAESLGLHPDMKLRSIKLIEQCLIGLGLDEDQALGITGPLHELNYLRSKVKGHASGEEAVQIKQKMLEEHGTYRRQFHRLCAQCDSSLRRIGEMLE